MSATHRRQHLQTNSKSRARMLLETLRIGLGVLTCSATVALAAEPATQSAAKSSAPPPGVETFDTAEQAGAALIDAAATFDEKRLVNLVGERDRDVILTGDADHDRKRAKEFTTEAAKKNHVAVDAKSGTRATVIVGDEDW